MYVLKMCAHIEIVSDTREINFLNEKKAFKYNTGGVIYSILG